MPWLFWSLAILLPVSPDFDTFFGGVYGRPWGHRGVTHSLTFALVLGLIAALCTYRRFKVNFWDLLGFFFLVTASHGILDAFTKHGGKVFFFWPFSDVAYGDWGPKIGRAHV